MIYLQIIFYSLYVKVLLLLKFNFKIGIVKKENLLINNNPKETIFVVFVFLVSHSIYHYMTFFKHNFYQLGFLKL